MTFSWWTFLFQALNFVVLAYVLHRLLYRPLRAAVERRREAHARAQAEAEKARQEAEGVRKQLQAQLDGLDRDRREAVREARRQAEGERRKLLAEAEQAAQRRREESRQALGRERDEALAALRGEVVGQAVELTRRLLCEAADRTLHQQLVLRLAEAVRDLPAAERAELRRQWRPDDGALLETAEELDCATLARLTEAVTAAVGGPAPLAVRTRPALLGGGRLRVGGHVWDVSLAGQLSEQNGNVGEGAP